MATLTWCEFLFWLIAMDQYSLLMLLFVMIVYLLIVEVITPQTTIHAIHVFVMHDTRSLKGRWLRRLYTQ